MSSNRVVWTGERRFDAYDEKQRLIKMDASATFGGTDTAPSPMDLLLMGLSGCTGIVMVIALEQQGVELKSLEIRSEGARTDDPGDFVSMRTLFEAKGPGVSHETMRKGIVDFVLPKAPVFCTLSRSCPISLGYVLDGTTMILNPETGDFTPAGAA